MKNKIRYFFDKTKFFGLSYIKIHYLQQSKINLQNIYFKFIY